jgi:hypothetical protein
VFGARKLVRGVFALSLGTTLDRGAKKLLLVPGDPGLGALNAWLFEGELRDGAKKLFDRGAPCAFGALNDCLFVGWLPEGTKRLTG